MTPPNGRDALVAAALMVSMYVLLIGQALGFKLLELNRTALLLTLPFMVAISMAVPTWLLLRHMRRRGLETGLRPLGKRGWHLLWQWPAVMFGSALLAGMLGDVLGLANDDESALVESVATEGYLLPVLMTLACYMLFAPFMEELVFRRVLMGYFDTRMPAALSVLASSVLFGLAHIAPPAILFTTFFGIGCALAVRWHNSLWAGVIIHMLNNSLLSLTALAAL